MRIFWKIYAWLLLFIGVSGEIMTNYIYTKKGLNFTDSVSTIMTLPMLIALFAYAYQKKIWKSGIYFWKAYLIIYFAINIYEIILILKKSNYPLESLIGFALGDIVMIIGFIGLYLYTFKFLEKD